MKKAHQTNHGAPIPEAELPRHPVYDGQLTPGLPYLKMREGETTGDFATRLMSALYGEE